MQQAVTRRLYPVLGVGIAAVLVLAAMVSLLPRAAAEPAQFTVTAKETGCSAGKNLCWDLTQIRVSLGETVSITFINPSENQLSHDLTIDEFNVQTNLLAPGDQQTVQFTADKAGTFAYYCSVPGHRAAGMEGSLIVEGGETPGPDMTLIIGIVVAVVVIGGIVAFLVMRSRQQK